MSLVFLQMSLFRESFPENENVSNINSPSSCSKSLWVSFFYGAQQNILVTKQLTVAIDFHSM